MATTRGSGERKRPFKDDWYDQQPDGSLKRRTKWFRTLAEAKTHARARQLARTGGRPTIDPGCTVAAVAARLETLIAATRRGNTLRYYRSNLETHILPRFGAWPMRELHRGAVVDFLLEVQMAPVLRNGKLLRAEHAKSTVRGILATISRLGAVATLSGICPLNPFLGLGKDLGFKVPAKARQNRVAAKAMTRAQLVRFLATVSVITPRLAPLFLLLARTGLRINEALALQVADVNLDAGTLRVERERVKDHEGAWTIGAPKSEHSVRTVRLSAQLAATLRHWLLVGRAADKLKHGWSDPPPWLFYADTDPARYDPADPTAGTLDDANVRRAMRAVLRHLAAEDVAAAVPVAERFPQHFTPHGFRHAFASILLAEGRSLQYVREQLGHESITLTADTYGAWLPSIDTQATDCLDDAEWSAPVSHHAG